MRIVFKVMGAAAEICMALLAFLPRKWIPDFVGEHDIVIWIILVVLLMVGIIGGTAMSGGTSKMYNRWAIATLVEMRDTGIFVNKLPQMELRVTYRTKRGEQVTAEFQAVFNYLALPKMMPGCELPIRYSEQYPRSVILDRD